MALATLVCRDGSSPRPLGSQMAVTGKGYCVGSLTGTGCGDRLIVHESLEAIREGQNRWLRLGAGSPFLDIRLPCGAGVEIYIDVQTGGCTLAELLKAHGARRPAALEIDTMASTSRVVMDTDVTPPSEGMVRRWLYPRQRLFVIGQGLNAMALSQVAVASGHEVMVFSPDEGTLMSAAQSGASTFRLSTARMFSCPELDPWTAAVTMFHDHDWEMPILQTLLGGSCYYLGALGSKRTHKRRVRQLRELGLADCARSLRGPAGLDIGAESPEEISLSILAEVTQVYRSVARPSLETGDFI
ncbi:MAG: XdhC family protein [Marinobacter vinifirmus]|uniref:XdhC family protein n=2 Tax=Marinobacter vinifirmus TaxID=355591 RepID=A0A558BCV4_9GAMM|nr:MAG: XdhC family protein [Marinobacter vinifirmus]